MDEFEFGDQRLPVRHGPPTDAETVFEDTVPDDQAAEGSSRSRAARLDRIEADDFNGEAAVRNDFAPALPAPTTAGLDAGVTIPVRTGPVPDATPTGRAAAVNDDANANDDPFADLLEQPVERPARVSPGGAYQQRVPGTSPGPATDATPGAQSTAASPTPTVRAQSHHRGEPTDLQPVVLRPAGALPGGVSFFFGKHIYRSSNP